MVGVAYSESLGSHIYDLAAKSRLVSYISAFLVSWIDFLRSHIGVATVMATGIHLIVCMHTRIKTMTSIIMGVRPHPTSPVCE